jgi:hypothetical protein
LHDALQILRRGSHDPRLPIDSTGTIIALDGCQRRKTIMYYGIGGTVLLILLVLLLLGRI